MLLACECDARGRLGLDQSAYPQRERLLEKGVATTAQYIPERERLTGEKLRELALKYRRRLVRLPNIDWDAIAREIEGGR